MFALNTTKATTKALWGERYSPAQYQWQVSLEPVLALLLFIALFTGFQGGRYYAGNAAQELGILSASLLYVTGAGYGLFHLPRKEWNRWVLLPLALLTFIICLWGLVFAYRFGGNPLYNMMASREFFFILLAPGIYLCCRCGLRLKTIEHVLWCVLILSAVNYLYNYFHMDLREAFFSSDHRVSSLVTYDEWRGFRLKPPLFAIMIALLAALMLLFSAGGLAQKLFAVLVLSMAIYIWNIVLFRSTLATMALSILLYPVMLSRPNRIHLWLVFCPLVILSTPLVYGFLLDHFQNAEGGDVRLQSYLLAIETIPGYFWLGVGEDSAFGVTYNEFFGPKFFPSDLGVVGIMFKYGLLGLSLYLFFHFYILIKLCWTNWHIQKTEGRTQPFLWAFLIFFSAQTFNLVLNPGLAYAQGITLGAFAVAYSELLRRRAQGQL